MQDNYLGKRPSQVPRSMNKVCAKIQSADSNYLACNCDLNQELLHNVDWFWILVSDWVRACVSRIKSISKG